MGRPGPNLAGRAGEGQVLAYPSVLCRAGQRSVPRVAPGPVCGPVQSQASAQSAGRLRGPAYGPVQSRPAQSAPGAAPGPAWLLRARQLGCGGHVRFSKRGARSTEPLSSSCSD